MLEKYTLTRKDNTDLNVYRCGFEECSPGFSWGPAVRDHYIIHYVLSGKGFYTINGLQYAIHAGEGFLICPDYVVSYQADPQDPWTYSWVGFHGLKAESILNKAGLNPSHPIFHYTDSSILKSILQDMILSARQAEGSDLFITGQLFIFLSHLVNHYQKNKTPDSLEAGGDGYVKKAVTYIAKNYDTRIRVNTVAKELGIDRSYLSALFVRYIGMPPLPFILRFKMDRAAELLKNPNLSVGAIARSVGYDDQLQFSKTFKKQYGLSPVLYRKEYGIS